MLFNELEIKSLFYDKPIKIDSEKSRIKIYTKGKFKYDRIIIETPKCNLAYDPKNNKYNSLAISLQPLSDSLKKFYTLLKKIDKKNKQILKELDKNIKYKSCMIKTKYDTKIAQFSIYENCPIYSKSKKKKTLSDLKIDNEVKMFLELNYIWIHGKKSGCNWKIIQLKFYPSVFNMNKCMFLSDTEESDNEDIDLPSMKNIKYIEKCLACQNISFCTGPQINKNPSQSKINIPKLQLNPILSHSKEESKFIPSVKDILNIKNKLNKVEK